MPFTRDFLVVFGMLLARLSPIWLALGLLISGGGILLAWLEQMPVSDGLYAAWITATTVGYGDITPHQPLAKLLCVILALIGIIFTGVITALALNASRVATERHISPNILRRDVEERLHHFPTKSPKAKP